MSNLVASWHGEVWRANGCGCWFELDPVRESVALLLWLGWAARESRKANGPTRNGWVKLRENHGIWRIVVCRSHQLFGDQLCNCKFSIYENLWTCSQWIWARTCLCTGKWSHQKAVVYISIDISCKATVGGGMFCYPTFLTCLKGCSMIQRLSEVHLCSQDRNKVVVSNSNGAPTSFFFDQALAALAARKRRKPAVMNCWWACGKGFQYIDEFATPKNMWKRNIQF